MHLLVVEDNPSTLKMLTFLLSNEGYIVHTATKGLEALEVLNSEPVDLIVLDVMLPDCNGLQVCRQVRDQGLTIPILVISALGRQEDKVAALNEGADDYVTKPFDPSEVLARVRSLIRRTQPTFAHELQTRLCVGPVCLDAPSQTVLISGTNADHSIELTKMECSLLHVLMRNAGDVMPHDQLIAEAWGVDYEGSSNQLEVYIHRLRTKLRKALPDMDLIRTIPGSGYEFVKEERGADSIGPVAVDRS
jgi:DNA-binding response OmpR family regulator